MRNLIICELNRPVIYCTARRVAAASVFLYATVASVRVAVGLLYFLLFIYQYFSFSFFRVIVTVNIAGASKSD